MIKDKQFVFIIGAPRSGSTWLHKILASHPEVSSTDAELTVFSSYVAPWMRTFLQEEKPIKSGKFNKGLPVLWDRKQFDNFILEFIEKVYSSMKILPQHKVIIDKHPVYSFYIKEINYYLPNAKYINIIRDGREMAYSWNRIWYKAGWGNPQFLGACLDWIKFNNNARKANSFSTNSYLEVKYEDLLLNTKVELGKILTFCGIRCLPEVVNMLVLENTGEQSMVSLPDNRFSFNERKSGKALWKTRLNKDEIYIARKHMGEALIEYGYENNLNWGLNTIESVWYAFRYRTLIIRSVFNKARIFFFAIVKKLYLKIFAKNRCSICDTRLISYLPLNPYFKEQLDKFGFRPLGKPETVNVKKYLCPFCKSSDRDRLYALYFKEVFSKLGKDKAYNFLDIAPCKPFRDFLSRYRFINRRSADLLMENVDDKINIEDMHIYKDGYFDFFICSHVLEHIGHPDKAMAELYRILKKGGKGIAMVPIVVGLDKTLEDPSHKTEAERWKNYGQGDHLRQFGKKDFINRLQQVGFNVRLLGIDHFGRKAFRMNGLLNTSMLYIVEK